MLREPVLVMGADGRLGSRKVRQIEAVVARPLAFVVATRWPWADAVTLGPGHQHYIVDRSTGEFQVRHEPVHWSRLCSQAESGEIPEHER